MQKELSTTKSSLPCPAYRQAGGRQGFSLIEIIISSALVFVLATLFIKAVLAGEDGTVTAGSRVRAQLVAEEGLEATRNIRDANFANLVNGTWGISYGGSAWAFLGNSDTEGIFTRTVQIGTVDAVTKAATSTATWQESGGRIGVVVLATNLTNTTVLPAGNQAGVLLPVYSQAVIGGATSKELQYITLQNTGSSAITLTKLKTSWTTGSSKMTQLYAGSTLVWSTAGPGSPLSQQSSGATTTIQSTTINPGDIIPLSRFVFTQNMHNNAFTIVFTMSDNSQKTIVTPLLP
ncbi:MAG: hypothetical protein Q7S26_00360 [bacterium]|nr:hypothetical protein [bacterium]